MEAADQSARLLWLQGQQLYTHFCVCWSSCCSWYTLLLLTVPPLVERELSAWDMRHDEPRSTSERLMIVPPSSPMSCTLSIRKQDTHLVTDHKVKRSSYEPCGLLTCTHHLALDQVGGEDCSWQRAAVLWDTLGTYHTKQLHMLVAACPGMLMAAAPAIHNGFITAPAQAVGCSLLRTNMT